MATVYLQNIEERKICHLHMTLRDTFPRLFSMLVYGVTNCMFACIVNRCVFWLGTWQCGIFALHMGM